MYTLNNLNYLTKKYFLHKTFNKMLYGGLILFLALFSALFFYPKGTEAYSRSEISQSMINESITILPFLNTAIQNFPCNEFPECKTETPKTTPSESLDATDTTPVTTIPLQEKNKEENKKENNGFIKEYDDIIKIYLDAYKNYLRGNYFKSYEYSLELEDAIIALLDKVSAFYLNRSSQMMDELMLYKDNEDDVTLLDIVLYYSRTSPNSIVFTTKRDVVPYTNRTYKPKDFTKLKNKRSMIVTLQESNKAYDSAKQAYTKAKNSIIVPLSYEEVLLQKEIPYAERRKKKNNHFENLQRIKFYQQSIRKSREAKRLSLHVYQLKYPFKNYAHHNSNFAYKEQVGQNKQTIQPIIECTQMDWTKNPYMKVGNLHPIFDLSIPSDYRIDMVDARSEIYQDEINRRIKLENILPEHRPTDIKFISDKNQCQND